MKFADPRRELSMQHAQQIMSQALGHMAAGRLAQAQAMLTRALQREATHPGLNQVMSLVLARMGKPEQAVYYMERAVRGDPSHAGLQHQLGLMLTNTPRRDEAERALRRALELDPRMGDAWAHLGALLSDLDRPSEAEAAMQHAVRLASTPQAAAIARLQLARALTHTGRVREAIETVRQVPAEFAGPEGLAQLAMLLNYDDASSADDVFGVHKRLGECFPSPPPVAIDRPDPERRLRVVLMSTDFREHSVASFASAIASHLPRDGFEIVGLYLGSRIDAVTRWFEQQCDRWHHQPGRGDEDLYAVLNAEKADVLIDLIGLSAQPRLSLLARGPCPITLTAIGYPNTTGLRAITHRLVDSITDPPGAERWATERLLRLDPCFLSYRPPEDAPNVAMREAGGEIVFGSFNNLAKLSDASLACWKRLLDRAPHARLLIKARGLEDAGVNAWWTRRLIDHGFDLGRVELCRPTPGRQAHLNTYAKIDVALDPFPYAGTTTTCEAMWMGVPVVTLPGGASGGDGHASRVGESLLRAVGLDRGIARSIDDYIEIAAGMAEDVAWRRHTRATLREAMRASVLCDEAGYGRRLGAAIRESWRAACHA